MQRKKITSTSEIETIHCSIDEAETTINIQRVNNYAEVWTSDNMMLTKLKKCMESNPDMYECYEGSRSNDGFITGYFFIIRDKKLVNFRKKKNNMTEEQRVAKSERFRQLRTKKGENE